MKTKVIDGVTYVDHIDLIAELDPYYGKSDGSGGYITKHHLGIMPLQHLGTSYMNSTNTTVGGFKGTYMHNTTIPKYIQGYENAYGSSHLLPFGSLISNSISSDAPSPGCTSWKGCANGWEWEQTKAALLTEVMVYGSSVWGGGYDVGEGCHQLACFRHRPELIHFQHDNFWVRTVASIHYFDYADGNGYPGSYNSSNELFVRLLLLLY